MISTYTIVHMVDNLETVSYDYENDLESAQDLNDIENLKAGLSALFRGVEWPL